MKMLILSCTLMMQMAVTAHANYSLDTSVLNGSQQRFLSNIGSGAFDSYLVMNLEYAPVQRLFIDLNQQLGGDLKNRGEAHITVITPIEYNDVLKNHLSMEEINAIALDERIQDTSFDVICLGRGSIWANGQREDAYYIVLESSDLLRIRKSIQERYVANGGQIMDFDPNHYYPHITVGFTQRDLHESDGILKNRASCIASIDLR